MSTSTEQVDNPEQVEETEGMENPYALLFEFENLVLPGRKAAFDVLKSIISDQGGKLDEALFSRFCIDAPLDVAIPNLLEALNAKRASIEKLEEDLNSGVLMHLSSPQATIQDGFKDFASQAAERGMATALMSNFNQDDVEGLLVKHGIKDLAPQFFTYNDGKGLLSRADAWLKAAKGLERNPQNCLVFVSSQGACKSALSAGMNCIVVPDAFTSYQDFSGADYVVEALSDLNVGDILSTFCPAIEG